METNLSLKALFESNQEKLAEKLSQFVLPKDAVNVQKTVQLYLNGLFDSDGEFRQNLTKSEDYILQAAMSLLNAQQAMVSEFSATSPIAARFSFGARTIIARKSRRGRTAVGLFGTKGIKSKM